MNLDEELYTDDLEKGLKSLRSSVLNVLTRLRSKRGDNRLEIKEIRLLRSELDRAINHLQGSTATTEERYKDFVALEQAANKALLKYQV